MRLIRCFASFLKALATTRLAIINCSRASWLLTLSKSDMRALACYMSASGLMKKRDRIDWLILSRRPSRSFLVLLTRQSTMLWLGRSWVARIGKESNRICWSFLRSFRSSSKTIWDRLDSEETPSSKVKAKRFIRMLRTLQMDLRNLLKRWNSFA